MVELVEIYAARDLQHAHLVKGALEDAGIPARVESSELGRLHPGFGGAFLAPRVFVLREHAERAAEVIREPSKTRGRIGA
ncbi:MAG: DUF2007 domain-containing protein [Planctomycetota bacterium]|nr:DUF2007 domain-containing protein [Planctomycetota bacterium]